MELQARLLHRLLFAVGKGELDKYIVRGTEEWSNLSSFNVDRSEIGQTYYCPQYCNGGFSYFVQFYGLLDCTLRPPRGQHGYETEYLSNRVAFRIQVHRFPGPRDYELGECVSCNNFVKKCDQTRYFPWYWPRTAVGEAEGERAFEDQLSIRESWFPVVDDEFFNYQMRRCQKHKLDFFTRKREEMDRLNLPSKYLDMLYQIAVQKEMKILETFDVDLYESIKQLKSIWCDDSVRFFNADCAAARADYFHYFIKIIGDSTKNDADGGFLMKRICEEVENCDEIEARFSSITDDKDLRDMCVWHTFTKMHKGLKVFDENITHVK